MRPGRDEISEQNRLQPEDAGKTEPNCGLDSAPPGKSYLPRAVSGVPGGFFASGAIIIREQGPNPIAAAEIVPALLLVFWAVGLYRLRALLASKLMIQGSPEYQSDFLQDSFTVTHNSSGQTGMKDVGYDRVWRLGETREFLVVMLNKHHGCALSKAGFTMGTAEEFKAFLRGRTGLEFTYFNI